MVDTIYVVLTLLPAVAFLLYQQLRNWRYKTFAHIPSPLSSNLFYGHVGYMTAGFKKAATPHIHPDYIFEGIWRDHGCPEFLFMDLRPTNYPILLLTSFELAEQVTRSTKERPYSVTKSPTLQENLGPVVGKHSMLSEDGESWKALRKRFNPAFAPQHLRSMLPVIFDKTAVFMKKLDDLTNSGAVAEMELLCTNLTFDIIGQVVMNFDYDAAQGDETFQSFRKLMSTYAKDDGIYPIHLDMPVQVKRRIYSRRFNADVKRWVQDKFDAMKAARGTETKTARDQSVLALALQDIKVLTPDILQVITDQVRSFVLAGHDTTSILLQRLLYVLSIHPACLSKIRAEHDTVFGASDPREVFLAQPDATVKALVYTSACIKETLRLWPPAGGARMSRNGFKMHTSEGDDVCIDDCIIYMIQHLIQRDAKVYGATADDFVPERWIGDVDTSAACDDEATPTGPGNVPTGAWRPFERGPRNCIGQELANLEARVVLACVIRRYDFVKVGVGEVEVDDKGQPVVDEKGKYKTTSEMYSRMSITSKPIDKMRMRVRLHAG